MNQDYNFDYSFGYNYNNDARKKFNDQIRYVPIDNSKKSDKDKDKEKKFGCCCDTDGLRELLLFFRRNNTPIIIFSKTFPIFGDPPENLTIYVNSIVGNLVYISRESRNGPVIAIIPLCEIDHVAVIPATPIPSLTELINKIIKKSTLEKDDCCCIKGIGDTINCLSNINLLFPFTDAILLEANDGVFVFILLILLIFQNNSRALANDDLYILITESENFNLYFITPICNISHFAVLDNLFDENGTENNILALFSKTRGEKLKNFNMNELLKEIKGKSLVEALKQIQSVLS